MGKTRLQLSGFLPAALKNRSYTFANVRFGTPSRNCSGVGICRVDLLDAQTKPDVSVQTCSSALAIMSPCEINGKPAIDVYFYAPSMRLCSIKQLFLRGGITLPEKVGLPKAITDAISCRKWFLDTGYCSISQEGVWLKMQVALTCTGNSGRFTQGIYKSALRQASMK